MLSPCPEWLMCNALARYFIHFCYFTLGVWCVCVHHQQNIENDERKSLRRLNVPAAKALLNSARNIHTELHKCCLFSVPETRNMRNTHREWESKRDENRNSLGALGACNAYGSRVFGLKSQCVFQTVVNWMYTTTTRVNRSEVCDDGERERAQKRDAEDNAMCAKCSRMEMTMAMCFEWNAVFWIECSVSLGASTLLLSVSVDCRSMQRCLRFRIVCHMNSWKQQMHSLSVLALSRRAMSLAACYMLHEQACDKIIVIYALSERLRLSAQKKLKLFFEKCVCKISQNISIPTSSYSKRSEAKAKKITP